MNRRSGLLRGDEGSVTGLFVIMVVAFFAVIGLVVDGGGKIRAAEHASDAAAQAARQGGEAIQATSAIGGHGAIIDAAAAQAAAQQYLNAAGVQGTAHVTATDTLIVDTTITYTPTFLSAVGIGSQTVHGHAQVLLLQPQDG